MVLLLKMCEVVLLLRPRDMWRYLTSHLCLGVCIEWCEIGICIVSARELSLVVMAALGMVLMLIVIIVREVISIRKSESFHYRELIRGLVSRLR